MMASAIIFLFFLVFNLVTYFEYRLRAESQKFQLPGSLLFLFLLFAILWWSETEVVKQIFWVSLFGISSGIVFLDENFRLIPNRYVFSIVCLGLMQQTDKAAVMENMIVAVFVYVVLRFLNVVYEKVTKKPAMGLGDIKILSALAVIIGLNIIFVLGAACLYGTIRHFRKKDFAFGPDVVLSFWSILLIFFLAAQF